jgi:toxin-antitoxin system PIN domain toxin
LPKPAYLLDVNVLIALTEPEHPNHDTVTRWFETPGLDWGLCPFSEAGFLRVSTNPRVGSHTVQEAALVLAELSRRPGYRFWPLTTGWAELGTPFAERIFGHQQITDAYLLGLAVKKNGILVTLDKAIRYLAGPKYGKHILVLE